MLNSNFQFRRAHKQMASVSPSFRRVSSTSSRLIESYCSNCGLFVAGSPAHCILEVMERLHQCQVMLPEMSRQRIEALMEELASKEQLLLKWIHSSERNTRWFATDPMGAIRAANLGIDEGTLRQLEAITNSIARKLRRAN